MIGLFNTPIEIIIGIVLWLQTKQVPRAGDRRSSQFPSFLSKSFGGLTSNPSFSSASVIPLQQQIGASR